MQIHNQPDPERDARTERMLDEYDTLRARLRELERELSRECIEYGRRRGVWGYRPDHLRIALAHEERQSGGSGKREHIT